VELWPCGSTEHALDELVKWWSQRDFEEVVRTTLRTGSATLRKGYRVKVIDHDIGFFTNRVKVRIKSVDSPEFKSLIGRECWTEAKGLER
jgi:hypothetical protein